MPEWLVESFQRQEGLAVAEIARRMGIALLLGFCVAGVYRATHGKLGRQSRALMATMVLLTILIAMVTIVIGSSVARAFSLVGALAIVRFRTVVQDTRDTAFVIFAVAVGMACGSREYLVAVIGIPLTGIAAYLFRPRSSAGSTRSSTWTLVIRVGVAYDPDTLLGKTLDTHASAVNLVTMTTARQGAAYDLTYNIRLRNADAVVPLVTELNGIEGVQNVELQQPSA